MVLVDQRNHGSSSLLPGLHPPHSIEASARDIVQLFRSRFGGRAPSVVLGHSLGGKVALEYLAQLAGGDTGLALPKQARVRAGVPSSPRASGAAA
jgi:pimeloyl-ACP methyl ester carboxylesterase